MSKFFLNQTEKLFTLFFFFSGRLVSTENVFLFIHKYKFTLYVNNDSQKTKQKKRQKKKKKQKKQNPVLTVLVL